MCWDFCRIDEGNFGNVHELLDLMQSLSLSGLILFDNYIIPTVLSFVGFLYSAS